MGRKKRPQPNSPRRTMLPTRPVQHPMKRNQKDPLRTERRDRKREVVTKRHPLQVMMRKPVLTRVLMRNPLLKHLVLTSNSPRREKKKLREKNPRPQPVVTSENSPKKPRMPSKAWTLMREMSLPRSSKENLRLLTSMRPKFRLLRKPSKLELRMHSPRLSRPSQKTLRRRSEKVLKPSRPPRKSTKVTMMVRSPMMAKAQRSANPREVETSNEHLTPCPTTRHPRLTSVSHEG